MGTDARTLHAEAVLRDTLGRCRLFAGLQADDLAAVAACSELRALKKNRYLFHQGDPVTGFYIVVRGCINAHRLSSDGREQVVRLFQPGETFAELALGGSARYPVSTRAETASSVVHVRREDLIQLIRRQPQLALRIIAAMGRHLTDLVNRLDQLANRTVGERLKEWLLSRCPPQDGGDSSVTIELTGTKALLAADLGTTPETLSRALARLQSLDLLRVQRRAFIIPAPDRLRQTTL
ncbi:MAG: Crp/Fnr family transcriptional regulator [Verrucomicrobiales bacterium]|nr:Crp/Fnr family transcriptional regulator [Verrucomicrobiales bacterium]